MTALFIRKVKDIMKKNTIIAMLVAVLVLMFSSVAGATTVSKILNGNYVGQYTSIQGKLTYLYDDYYQITDYNGDYMRVNMGGMDRIEEGRNLTVEGYVMIQDNTITLDCCFVHYDQDRDGGRNTSTVTIGKILDGGDRYMGRMVAIEGRIKDNLGDDYCYFVDRNGDNVTVKMNTTVIEQNARIRIYGVANINNGRLEIDLDRFDYL